MRTTVLLLVSLLLTACGLDVQADATPPRLTLPSPGQSVVFGPLEAPTGGTIVVGHLIETRPSRTLVELMGAEAWQGFLEEERKLASGEDVEEIEIEIVEGDPWQLEQEHRGRKKLRSALQKRVEADTHVRVLFRDVLPTECDGLPLVITDRASLHENEQLALEGWLQSGGTLLSLTKPDAPEELDALALSIRQAIKDSPLVHRLPADPLRIERAHREGDLVHVDFADPEVVASLRDLDDALVAQARPDPDGKVAFPCPDPRLDPYRHRIVAAWTQDGLTLRRAWPVVDLVGTAERRVIARPIVIVGAAYAPHVWFQNSLTKEPVAGVRERIALVRGDQELASAHGTTNEAGGLGLHLDVPAGTRPGQAELLIGEDRFPVRVQESLRVSVVTDRSLYKATDKVHVRVMVHDGARGAPVSGREVLLRRAGVEKRVTTSKHGIASTTFRLVGAKLGLTAIEAVVGHAKAKASFLIRAFERPTYLVELEPDHLTLHPGDEAPIVVRATYVNGSPVVGAAVSFRAPREFTVAPQAKTDAQGRVEVTLKARKEARDPRLFVRVRDADGRTTDLVLPVSVVSREKQVAPLRVVELTDLVPGLEGRVRIQGEAGATVKVRTRKGPRTLTLDEAGQADLPYTPNGKGARVFASYADEALQAHPLCVVEAKQNVAVLRPARRTARVGETLPLQVRAPEGPVLLEVLRDGTTLRSLALLARGGKATVDLPLEADLAGLLKIGAWVPGMDVGSQVRVLVTRDRALDVQGTVAAPSYRPGHVAIVDVSVKDRGGAPTAAVLGYWGVDEALLALRAWEDGYEGVFDVAAAAAPNEQKRLAQRIERGGDDYRDALQTLGSIQAGRRLLSGHVLRHDGGAARRDALKTATLTRASGGVDALRAAYLQAFAEMPLTAVRTASSLREVLARLVQQGRLDRALCFDPWGTPFDVRHGCVTMWEEIVELELFAEHTRAVPVNSAGPDLVLRTGDDWESLFALPDATELPERLVHFLDYVQRYVESEREEHDGAEVRRNRLGVDGLSDSPFTGPSTNGVIGLGGGAGGAFRGRGGGRYTGVKGGHRAGEYAPPVYVREDLEPTLCFVPEMIVGPDGKARLEIPLKDSITTWRLRLVASAADGATGVSETRIKVSQPLHVDPWVATHLTVGDRLDLPVAIRNETAEAIETVVVLKTTDGLDVLGPKRLTASVGPGGTGSVSFRLHASARGTARLRVDVDSGTHRDAIRRIVHIRPNAREVDETLHATLERGRAWNPNLAALADDVDRDVRLKLYASPMATLIGGLEGLLTCPHG